ncbi:hypothetical protein N7540_011161 [Penicillium herquei]|uniref:uncharacterized protein n=1 Tax=Penicillium nucicola TaxID=1850975 RepID=UPI00254541A2|nr:uncharacterized protein N7511_008451 [Penicillium nucicola]KAJ5751486.1 hypothetical protein N7511_008451 [Penicillium nucicola]KAJ6016570.1 hypothetical protein N7540_011161 [Penicillium herquei]
MSVQIDNHQSVIDFCRSCSDDQLIGGSKYGNRVVKLPNYDLVVKFGQHVSSYEAKNQEEAHSLIDSNVVLVPRAYKFFVDDEGWGYMVSDYVLGKTIDPLPESHIQKLAKVLEYFCSITSERAGSLCGGPSTGLIWPDTNDLFISSVQQVEDWFNSRLFPGDGEVHLDPSPLVLCHLDIAPRNLIWLDDGRVCLLDWASAGFYPRPLEFASLFFQEYNFSEALLNATGFGSGRDKEEQQKMCQALYNNERYSL